MTALWSCIRININAKAAEAVHGPITLSRLGTIVTMKDEGKKVCLIHDLRRSLVDAQVTMRERLVLPRVGDAAEDIVDLLTDTEDPEVALGVVDFKDAFKHFRVAPEEQGVLSGRAWATSK